MTRNMPAPTQMLILALAGLTVLLAPLARAIVPSQFLRDDRHLQRVIADPGVTPENDSFQLMASAYRAAGLGSHPYMTAALTGALLVVAVFLAVSFADWARAGVMGFAVAGIAFGFCCLYLAQYTKELASLFVAVVVLLLLRTRSELTKYVAIPGVCLAYGLLLRPYWILIAALVPGLVVLLRRRRSLLLLLAAVVVALVLLNFAFEIFRDGSLGAERAWINDQRADTAVATEITSVHLGEHTPGLVASTLIVLGQLVVPVPLLLVGDIYYAPAAIAALLLWGIVLLAIRRGTCLVDPGGQAANLSSSARGSRRRWAAAVLLSLVLVQATFEPDYGSYLKHLTAFIPLFLVLVPLHNEAEESLRSAQNRSTGLQEKPIPAQMVEGVSG